MQIKFSIARVECRLKVEVKKEPSRLKRELKCAVSELQSLWVERTTLTLVQSLPGISRWFEVDKRELVSETQSCHAGDANTVIYFALRNLKMRPVDRPGIDFSCYI